MKKLAIIVGVLSVLATGLMADKCSPSFTWGGDGTDTSDTTE